MVDGISRTGQGAEDLFLRLTGFSRCKERASGDALVELDGICHYIEVKKCASATGTINQVRPIKFIPLVIYDDRDQSWYVVDPVQLVAEAARRGRGQHTDIPFESMILNVNKWRAAAVDAGELRAKVEAAIRTGLANPALRECMRELRDGIVQLSEDYKKRVLELLAKKT